MIVAVAVHIRGATAFATLPGDSFEYRVEYEQSEGRVWLKSCKTEREWECSIDNRRFVGSDPVYCNQFDVEMELLELALHPRTHKTGVCKHVGVTRSGDDLVMQLSPKLYSQSNPVQRSPLQFTLTWVRCSGSLRHGPSRDPPEAAEPPKPKVPRAEQQKELLARFRAENKALKAEKRERTVEAKRLKSDNDALQREVHLLRDRYGDYQTNVLRQSTRSEVDVLRRENTQLKQARDGQHAHLIRLGGSHEFQRQHIEHLRRKIQALEQQLRARAQFGGGQQRYPLDDDSDDQAEEQLHQESGAEDAVAIAATERSKRRRTSRS